MNFSVECYKNVMFKLKSSPLPENNIRQIPVIRKLQLSIYYLENQKIESPQTTPDKNNTFPKLRKQFLLIQIVELTIFLLFFLSLI